LTKSGQRRNRPDEETASSSVLLLAVAPRDLLEQRWLDLVLTNYGNSAVRKSLRLAVRLPPSSKARSPRIDPGPICTTGWSGQIAEALELHQELGPLARKKPSWGSDLGSAHDLSCAYGGGDLDAAEADAQQDLEVCVTGGLPCQEVAKKLADEVLKAIT
jgi:hypothetical protein